MPLTDYVTKTNKYIFSTTLNLLIHIRINDCDCYFLQNVAVPNRHSTTHALTQFSRLLK